MTAPPTPPVGYLNEQQRRRVQALTCVVMLLPTMAPWQQVQVARWIVTGVASQQP